MSHVRSLSITHRTPTALEKCLCFRAIETAPGSSSMLFCLIQGCMFNWSIFIKYLEILRVTQQYLIYILIRESRWSEGRKECERQHQSERQGSSLQNVFSGVRTGKAFPSQGHQRQGAPSPGCGAGSVWLSLAQRLRSDSEWRGAMFFMCNPEWVGAFVWEPLQLPKWVHPSELSA